MIRKTEINNTTQGKDIVQRVIGISFGVIEIALVFRLIFKWLGANPTNSFVGFLYDTTQVVVGLFEGIFSKVGNKGDEVAGIFEPATLIAIIVVGVLGWALLNLITPGITNRFKRTEYAKLQ